MRLIVLGHAGMLGSTLYRKLIDTGYSPEIVSYKIFTVQDVPDLSCYDIVFNCIGAIPQKKRNFADMVWANVVIPRLLSRTARKLVHFSTDCVFSGLHNTSDGYQDTTTDWGVDDYSWSKRHGEIKDSPGVLNIRTSIIGHRGPVGLLDWFLYGTHPKNDEGTEYVAGYANHYWNGFTTNELANIIIRNINYIQACLSGVVQLGGEKISKYVLLDTIKKVYLKNTIIQSEAGGPTINKCLQTSLVGSGFSHSRKPVEKQIREMREDEIRWFGRC